MATIEADECVTLINTFTVRPEKQARLIEVLDEATEQVMRHQSGFISASIHKSLDGKRVANYAQWTSKEDLEAMLADPDCREHMAKAAAMAERFEPVLYSVSSVHERLAYGMPYSPDIFVTL
jgi:quinol monooxygenase YgiN